MKDSHAHLKITAAEWLAFMDDLQQSLDKFTVPAAEQAEIYAIVDTTRADIVYPETATEGPAITAAAEEMASASVSRA